MNYLRMVFSNMDDKNNCQSTVDHSEHLHLVATIQKWHKTLREKIQSRAGEDPDEIWAECCRDKNQLDVYSQAMHRLATTAWEKNNNFTRIDWCYATAMNYYHQGQMEIILNKERELCIQCHQIATSIRLPIRLLDVGSCYAPFSKYKTTILPLSIDLYPAISDVLQCDFLKLTVSDNVEINLSDLSSLPETISHLPANFFHVVVFSLFLDYLPTTRQRWQSCEKALKLLRSEGLLLVVTPDSKHQNKNANMIKSWKNALFKIGFVRIVHEKLRHVHCMAFRKQTKCEDCIWKKTRRQYFGSDEQHDHNLMFIPQDFRKCDKSETKSNIWENSYRESDDEIRDGFFQLPFEI